METIFFQSLLPFSSIFTAVWKNGRKWFPLARKSVTLVKYGLSFKIGFHQFKLRFPLEGKVSELKKTVSTSRKIRFHKLKWRNFIEKDTLTRRKINYHWQESLKKGEKKMISTSQKARMNKKKKKMVFSGRNMVRL